MVALCQTSQTLLVIVDTGVSPEEIWQLSSHSTRKAGEVAGPENVFNRFQSLARDAMEWNPVPQDSPRFLTRPKSAMQHEKICRVPVRRNWCSPYTFPHLPPVKVGT